MKKLLLTMCLFLIVFVPVCFAGDIERAGGGGVGVETDPTVDTSAEIQAIIGAGVYQASGSYATISSGRIPALSQYYNFSIPDPANFYSLDTHLCIDKAVPADMTITRIEITCDANPTTELDADLKWADAFIGLANATVIEAADTTDGVVDITSNIDDATIASGKCVYLQFNAEPDVAIKQIKVKITYDFD